MPYVEREIIVMAPSDTVYQVWRNFENFPGFMHNIEEVRHIDDTRSHWRASGALGKDAEWDAVITLDEPGRAIGWKSLDYGDTNVDTAGTVRFEPVGEATRVRVELSYEPRSGGIADVIARIFSDPEGQLEEDLARFKEGMERGGVYRKSTYIVRADGSQEDGMSETKHKYPDNEKKPAGPKGPGMSDVNGAEEAGRPPTTSTPGGTLGAPTEGDLERDQRQVSDRSDSRMPDDTTSPLSRDASLGRHEYEDHRDVDAADDGSTPTGR